MLKTKVILGYLGFIPFAAFTILPWILGEKWLRPSLISLIIYGAIILSFLGGIIWQSSKKQSDLVSGILFSLLGFVSIFLFTVNVMIPLIILALSFPLCYLQEKRTSDSFSDEDYAILRLNLTTGVTACFVLSIFSTIGLFTQ
jgi:predicted neutral ceramidase superfamily lipid hydrolase